MKVDAMQKKIAAITVFTVLDRHLNLKTGAKLKLPLSTTI